MNRNPLHIWIAFESLRLRLIAESATPTCNPHPSLPPYQGEGVGSTRGITSLMRGYEDSAHEDPRERGPFLFPRRRSMLRRLRRPGL